eukprot:TRINITY_DN9296_c0_g1_i1.p1 TRINITY_DN9296_c0_g1~~TRINITY_DN9296_c0_g1_i1.p1  ORF type:complete len:453 (-),score=82.40 TRINITY_DN9296_c0_g1_i1:160-1347(-)
MKSIREPKIEEIEGDLAKRNEKCCFVIQPQDLEQRSPYYIEAKTAKEKSEWMAAIKAVRKLHNTFLEIETKRKEKEKQDKARQDGVHSADGVTTFNNDDEDEEQEEDGEISIAGQAFRESMIVQVKAVVKEMTVITGIFKNVGHQDALKNKKKLAIIRKTSQTNTAKQILMEVIGLGGSAVELIISALDAYDHPFNLSKTEIVIKTGVYLKGVVGHLSSFAKGTANEAATMYSIKKLLEELDKLNTLVLPNPKNEIVSVIASLTDLFNILYNEGKADPTKLTHDIILAGNNVANCIRDISQSIPSQRDQNSLLDISRSIPTNVDCCLKDYKAQQNFSNMAAVSEDPKDQLKEILDKVVQTVVNGFPSSKSEAPSKVANRLSRAPTCIGSSISVGL